MKHVLVLLSITLHLLLSTIATADGSATTDSPPTMGLDHVGLAVSDLEASKAFFVDTLGFKVSGQDKDYPAAFLNNGQMSLTLWQTKSPSVKFNRKHNVGLHHLAIRVVSVEALDALHTKIKTLANVKIEFAPELSYGGPAKHMMIREPSGNRLELIHRPQ